MACMASVVTVMVLIVLGVMMVVQKVVGVNKGRHKSLQSWSYGGDNGILLIIPAIHVN